ncbi:MAG: tryptophan-rich sensory protein [Erythrobacter sp.]|jgi:tryptophan-rich sensory protein
MNMLASRGQLRASFIRWALFCVPLVVLLGVLAAALGNPNSAWLQTLSMPEGLPDPARFDLAWKGLCVVVGLALTLVASAWGARGRAVALWAFAVHFALSLAWLPTFFTAHQLTLGLGLLVLVDLTLLAVLVLFWTVRRAAALLLLPYLAWVLFMTLLNYQLLQLNPDADGAGDAGQIERVRIDV